MCECAIHALRLRERKTERDKRDDEKDKVEEGEEEREGKERAGVSLPLPSAV